MSLRPGWSPAPINLTVISARGGLGDAIARLPAFRYMDEHYPHVTATIYVQDGWFDLVKYLLPESPRRSYRRLSQAPFYLPKPYVEFNHDRITSLFCHLTDQAYLMLMDMQPPDLESRAYPEAELATLPKYPGLLCQALDEGMVVFTTDHTAESRRWLPRHINELATKVRDAGLTPVLLGTKEPIPSGVENDPIRPQAATGLKEELFVDLRGKTTLIEALGVMQRARAVVGVDNGLLHLAHCSDTPVVMGFTTLKPVHRVPVRIIDQWDDVKGYGAGIARGARLTKVIEAQVPCAGCQSRGWHIQRDVKGNFMDWRKCVFDDYACLLTLTADRFYEKLQELKVVP